MKKAIPSGLCLVALGLIPGSCTHDFEETNTNPNQPEQVSADLLLPTVIRGPVNSYYNLAWGYGNIVMQYVAKIQFTSEDRLAWGPQDGAWFYDTLRDLKNLIEMAEENGQHNYQGIGLVLRGWIYSFMTDTYGDIPYTEAIQGKESQHYFPAYDPQETVYQGIIRDLEEAGELLGSTAETVEGDILYDGDLMKWRKFANSLLLRIHLRLSDKTDPSAGMSRILSNPEQYPVFESNDDQAALEYLAAAPNQQPLYTTRSGSFDEFRLSTTMEERLKALEDPRLYVFAQPTTESRVAATEAGSMDLLVFDGVPNGLADERALQYSPSGDPEKGGSNFISRVGLMWACEACSDDASPTAAQAVLMSYAELQFILAEAREGGYITAGEAGDYYQEGIKASFEYYQSRLVQPAEPWYTISLNWDEHYLEEPGVSYTGTREQKLEKIALQKWIALFFNGLEAWFDWRRTGLPQTIPGPDNVNANRTPRRFMYPGNEQALNRANYEAAIERQGPDDINTRIWLDQ